MSQSSSFPILDGHNDTILALSRCAPGEERTFLERSDFGHVDLPRAREGGLAGGFFAVFTPNTDWEKVRIPRTVSDEEGEAATAGWDVPHPNPIDPAYALDFTLSLLARLIRIESESGGQVRIARTVDEVTACMDDDVLAMILHVEGAEAIDPDLERLDLLYAAGLRSLGPVWSRSNAFGHGVPFGFPGSPDAGPGLTEPGRALVTRCNELGVLIDLSHLNEKGFWDVADLSSAPLVATHSCAHVLCPSPRNLTDEQLDAVGESGGVVGINFARGFLRADGDADAETPLTEIARHAAYVAERIGVEHVALGSDFDGAQVPQDLKDAARLPLLLNSLRDRGFDNAGLTALTHGNWIRILRDTWK